VTWKGAAIVVLICVVNAVRRTIQPFLYDQTLARSVAQAAEIMVLGIVVAVPVALAVVATYNVAPRRPSLRYPALALAVALSCTAGVAVAVALETAMVCDGAFASCFQWPSMADMVSAWVRYGLLCALFTVVFVHIRAADESAVRLRQAERDRTMFVQRMGEARLRVLQAQIEPHFLFNTLANVRRLYQTAPRDAAAMLDHLMRYFEVALPQMRAADSTLGREADLTQSYLAIQQIRMGRRLDYAIDIPPSLRNAALPPMMLLTLAENAIKHGLAPLAEGGSIRISASVRADELEVRVADSGRGFMQTSGGGTGLANIRARLAGMHGAQSRLTLALNAPRGIMATIVVPLISVPAGSGA
jgi:hypothetical protein